MKSWVEWLGEALLLPSKVFEPVDCRSAVQFWDAVHDGQGKAARVDRAGTAGPALGRAIAARQEALGGTSGRASVGLHCIEQIAGLIALTGDRFRATWLLGCGRSILDEC